MRVRGVTRSLPKVVNSAVQMAAISLDDLRRSLVIALPQVDDYPVPAVRLSPPGRDPGRVTLRAETTSDLIVHERMEPGPRSQPA
jgi:hypothetical protein